jgi:hypothetical protein
MTPEAPLGHNCPSPPPYSRLQEPPERAGMPPRPVGAPEWKSAKKQLRGLGYYSKQKRSLVTKTSSLVLELMALETPTQICEVQSTSAPQNCLPSAWGTRIHTALPYLSSGVMDLSVAYFDNPRNRGGGAEMRLDTQGAIGGAASRTFRVSGPLNERQITGAAPP